MGIAPSFSFPLVSVPIDWNLFISLLWEVDYFSHRVAYVGFPGGSVVKKMPAKAADAGDTGLIPGWGNPVD